jgi:hypothetical protein
VVILLFTSHLGQADIVLLTPSAPVVTQGCTFDLDLSALGIGLGAYDVTIAYNPLLAAIDDTLVSFDTHLGGPSDSLAFTSSGLDTLELVEVSFLTDPVDLSALQPGTGYALAHIAVRALQPGVASFDFVATPSSVASDYAGVPIEGVAFEGTSVRIESAAGPPPSAVPEPVSASLLLTVLGGLGLAKYGRAARNSSTRSLLDPLTPERFDNRR